MAIQIAPNKVFLTVQNYTFNHHKEIFAEFRALLKRLKLELIRELPCQDITNILKTHPMTDKTPAQLLIEALIEDPSEICGVHRSTAPSLPAPIRVCTSSPCPPGQACQWPAGEGQYEPQCVPWSPHGRIYIRRRIRW